MGSLKKNILFAIFGIILILTISIRLFSYTQLTKVINKNQLEERVSFVMENATSLERTLTDAIRPADYLYAGLRQEAEAIGRPKNKEALQLWLSHLTPLLLQKYAPHSDHTEIHLIFLDKKGQPLERGLHFIDANFDGYWDQGHLDENPITKEDIKKIKVLLGNSTSSAWLSESLSSHAFITGSYIWSYGRSFEYSGEPYALIILSGTSDVFKNSLKTSAYDPIPSIALLDAHLKPVVESPDYNPEIMSSFYEWPKSTYQDTATKAYYDLYQNKNLKGNPRVLSRTLENGWVLLYKLPDSLYEISIPLTQPQMTIGIFLFLLGTLIVSNLFARHYDQLLQDFIKVLTTSPEQEDSFPLLTNALVSRKDEIGSLMQSFNTLSHSLNESKKELDDLKTALEQKVEEQGRELMHTHQLLSQSVDTLKNQNEQLETVHKLLSNNAHIIQESRKSMYQLEKMASLKFLVSGVAHELNTPIGNAITLATFMEQEFTSLLLSMSSEKSIKRERLVDSVRTLRDSVSQLERNILQSQSIIEQIELLAQLDQSEEVVCLTLESFVKDLLRSMVGQISPPIEVIIVNRCTYQNVYTDPSKLSNLLRPLIQNSLDHGFSHQSPGSIRIILENEEDCLVIDYRDSGVGVSEEVFNHMLTPFYSSSFGSHRGLGLSFVYNLCTQYYQGNFEPYRSPEGGFHAKCTLRHIKCCNS